MEFNKSYSQNVLELGSGVNPAVKEQGKIFKDGTVRYIGIDLPSSFSGLNRDADLIGAEVGRLPLRENSIDTIIMRSMFGQFKDSPRSWTSHLDNVRMAGLWEAFRVLKPGGKIFVFEENTPMENDLVEYWLKYAGFSIKDYQQMNESYEDVPENDPWKIIRSQFYQKNPLKMPNDIAYVLVGEKPFDSEVENIDSELVYRGVDGKWKRSKRFIFVKGKENTDPPIVPTPEYTTWQG